MEKYERLMAILGVIYSCVMALVGWRTAVLLEWDPLAVGVCACGTLCLIVGFLGWLRARLTWVAVAVVGCAVFFPTQWGLPAMIPGFVLLFLIIGLKVFTVIDEGV